MTDIGYADTDYIIKWSLGNNINYMLEELTCQELSEMFEKYYPGKIENVITYNTFVETYMEEKVKGGDLLSCVRIVEERWGDRFVNVADVEDEQLRRDYGIFGWDRVDEMLHIINNEWQSLEEVNPLVLWDENAVISSDEDESMNEEDSDSRLETESSSNESEGEMDEDEETDEDSWAAVERMFEEHEESLMHEVY